MNLIIEIYSGAKKIIAIIVLFGHVIKYNVRENNSWQGKLKSAIQIKLITQHFNTETLQFGLAHTLMCITCSVGFLILRWLFLKPTRLYNMHRSISQVTAEAFVSLSLAFVTASEEQHVQLFLEKITRNLNFYK